MHANMFKQTRESFEKEEGKLKIQKVRELTKLAETGKIIPPSPACQLTARVLELDCKVHHLALAWVAINPNTSTVILGATSPEQVIDNLKALAVIPKLTKDVLDRIEGILENRPEKEVSKRGAWPGGQDLRSRFNVLILTFCRAAMVGRYWMCMGGCEATNREL
jgi:hypothetical protein